MNQRGTTLVETIVATVIIAGSIVGIVQAFSYGRIHVEKMGLLRQALGELQGEMEYWQRVHLQDPHASLEPGDAAARKRLVQLVESKKIMATVEPRVFPPQSEGENLRSQAVNVKVYYQYAVFSDTVDLSAKFYIQ